MKKTPLLPPKKRSYADDSSTKSNDKSTPVVKKQVLANPTFQLSECDASDNDMLMATSHVENNILSPPPLQDFKISDESNKTASVNAKSGPISTGILSEAKFSPAGINKTGQNNNNLNSKKSHFRVPHINRSRWGKSYYPNSDSKHTPWYVRPGKQQQRHNNVGTHAGHEQG